MRTIGKIKTTSDLREMLGALLTDFSEGKATVQEALTVTKITAQITRSLDADIAFSKLALEHNLPAPKLGAVSLVLEKEPAVELRAAS